jgi:probable phosphoglycerate mutase
VAAPPKSAQGRFPAGLWLVRHGESAGNVARELAEARQADRIEIEVQRDMDVPLSPLGERQARALGRWISEQPEERRPTVALTSPYVRAHRTAEVMLASAGLARLRLVVDERLREREFGILDRLTRRGITTLFPEQAALRKAVGKFYHRPPGGESWCDVILRLRSLLGTLSLESRGERVLVVSHTVVVLCFRYVLEQLNEQQILQIDREAELANCSLTSYELDHQRGVLALRHYNLVAPLEEHGAPVTTEPDVPVAPNG